MFQLKFDENLNNITRDIKYWSNEQDIKENIKNYIIEKQKDKIIHDIEDDTCYCFECMTKLDESFYCTNCQSQKAKDKEEYLEKYSSENLEYSYNEDYFVFDIIGINVILYEIGLIGRIFHNPHLKKTIKNYEFNVNRAFLIEKNSFTNLKTNKTYTYEEYYNNIYNKGNNDSLEIYMAEVYKENLQELKNTVYKYSYLWIASDYFKDNNLISLEHLIFVPLYFKNFDLLMKEKLFDLTFTTYNMSKSAKSFVEIYKIDKKYIPFIRDNNLTYQEVKLLKAYPKEDIETIRYFSLNIYLSETIIQIIDKYKIDLRYLKEYITLQSTKDEELIHEYFDYIRIAEELKMNLKDKKILYPNNLVEEHNKLFLKIKTLNNPNINKKIKAISKILSLNKYEDEKHIIYPASSIEDLIKESAEQHNCVKLYVDRVANNESQIYFLRQKDNPNKSYVTVEVYDNKVIQAKSKYNANVSKEIKDFLNKWEKTLIPVRNKITKM